MFAVALAIIHRRPADLKAGVTEVDVVMPGTVFEVDDAEFAMLNELNAVRPATDEEKPVARKTGDGAAKPSKPSRPSGGEAA